MIEITEFEPKPYKKSKKPSAVKFGLIAWLAVFLAHKVKYLHITKYKIKRFGCAFCLPGQTGNESSLFYKTLKLAQANLSVFGFLVKASPSGDKRICWRTFGISSIINFSMLVILVFTSTFVFGE